MKLLLTHFPDASEHRPLLPGRLGYAWGQFMFGARYKRNARTSEYMKSLAADLPDAGMTEAGEVSRRELREADEIILLWPDSLGWGWFWLELRVFLFKSRRCRVEVLNGRKRRFELSMGAWAGCLARRWIERFWLGELAFTFIFLATSPFLVTWDFLRGRR